MLRNCLRLTLLTLGLLAASGAVAQDRNNGFFLGAKGGNAFVSEEQFDDTTTAFEIGGGFRWNGWGIEGGYVTFNDFEDDVDDIPVNAALDGYILGVNGRFNFSDNWYVGGRLGAFFWDADANLSLCVITGTSETCEQIDADDDGTSFYAGVGIGYDFNESFSLGAEYDYFGAELESESGEDSNLDTNVFWVTAELRF